MMSVIIHFCPGLAHIKSRLNTPSNNIIWHQEYEYIKYYDAQKLGLNTVVPHRPK
jgi:hypothetical protein